MAAASLVGSWVSAILRRRRCLCLVEVSYEAMRGRALDDVLRISAALRTELFVIANLAPFCQADIRSKPPDKVHTVDASS